MENEKSILNVSCNWKVERKKECNPNSFCVYRALWDLARPASLLSSLLFLPFSRHTSSFLGTLSYPSNSSQCHVLCLRSLWMPFPLPREPFPMRFAWLNRSHLLGISLNLTSTKRMPFLLFSLTSVLFSLLHLLFYSSEISSIHETMSFTRARTVYVLSTPAQPAASSVQHMADIQVH